MSARLVELGFAHPGHPPLFQGFSLDLAPGSVTALLGPSGSGKSTLLRLVAGLLRPDGGRVERGPGTVGVVFQDPRLLPWLSVAENAGFALTAAGVPRAEHAARVAPLLAAVGLDGAALPRTLSGGMAQRAALVRALALRPDLLLLDEPFGAVDPLLREELQALVQPLLRGVTTLLVTHDIPEAVTLADRVLVLGGRPVGVREDLLIAAERPRDLDFRDTQMFHGAVAQLRRAVFGPR